MGRNICEASEEKQEEMMSMTRRSPVRMRPAVDAAPRIDVVQSDKEALTGGGFTALLEILPRILDPILSRLCWRMKEILECTLIQGDRKGSPLLYTGLPSCSIRI